MYHTPSGRVIQNVGIIPDIAVENLKIQKNAANDDLAMIEPLKEYQLKNHIATTDSNPLNATLQAQNDFALASEDFQLFQALKILRTMHVVGQMQNQSTTTVAKAAS